jgi:hypothetical protein
MDRLRVLAIQVARKILAEERETPGSQTRQNLDVAGHFLSMIGDGADEAMAADYQQPALPQSATPSASH